MKATNATIYDVAKLAGVSVATVSRCLNGTATVSPDAQARIENAIAALDFSPNRLARALKTDHTRLIMMVVPDIGNEFYARQYKVVQSIGDANGYAIMLYNSNESAENEQKAFEMARTHRCDGMLLFSVFDTERLMPKINTLRIPVMHTPSLRLELDYEIGIYKTTKHLISYGHKDILYVGGSSLSCVNLQRSNGFVRAMDEAGLAYNRRDWFEMDFTLEAGFKAGCYVSTLNKKPTAICAANDQLAIGILRAFLERGIRVPEDISITGMDNVEYAALMNPPLTTIDNEPEASATYLMEKLLCLIEGRDAGAVTRQESNNAVIVRESTRRI